MIINILFIIAGVAVVIWGADRMTDGAVAIAQRMNIPQIIIGLTVVAMGTSMPEFFVSLMSSLKGTTDLAVGNVVGSNIFNTLLIVGTAAAVTPIVVTKSTVQKDMTWSILASVMLTVMCLDKGISRIDALILTIAFVIFMAYTIRGGLHGKAEASEEATQKYGIWTSLGLILLGLACLIFGSNLFVDNATEVARQLGVSDAVIGLTIVAGGTSMPELATSVVAARKGQSAIAIGNVIGSNVFNVLMILGITGLIHPMPIEGITNIDLSILTLSILLLWLFSFTKFKVERWEGLTLMAIDVAYVCWLIYNAVSLPQNP